MAYEASSPASKAIKVGRLAPEWPQRPPKVGLGCLFDLICQFHSSLDYMEVKSVNSDSIAQQKGLFNPVTYETKQVVQKLPKATFQGLYLGSTCRLINKLSVSVKRQPIARSSTFGFSNAQANAIPPKSLPLPTHDKIVDIYTIGQCNFTIFDLLKIH